MWKTLKNRFLSKGNLKPEVVESSLVTPDPRWLKIKNTKWNCMSCGKSHHGIIDLAQNKPDVWQFGPEVERNTMHNELMCFLSDDQCIMHGKDYFIRCMLYLPIVNTNGDSLGLGVWSSLSKENFELYDKTFHKEDVEGLGPWFGWFSNSLKGYPETLNLKCSITPNANGVRPAITLEENDHPLSIDQHRGITIDRLVEIFAVNGHRISI
jgi:hypothetical protein